MAASDKGSVRRYCCQAGSLRAGAVGGAGGMVQANPDAVAVGERMSKTPLLNNAQVDAF